MRKYFIGILIGVALTISSSVFAEDIKSLIGQKIQGEFPVKVSGKTLEKPAIVIDGTSYLPNRVLADALNMDITFNADLGIELKKKEAVNTMDSPITEQSTPSPSTTNQPLSLIEINEKIKTLNMTIAFARQSLENAIASGNTNTEKSELALEKRESELAELEKQKAALTP